MIIAHGLSLSFGQQKILDQLSFILANNDRVGLVGLNGSGKSTLLNVIAGGQQLDAGSVHVNAGKTIAYFPQEIVLTSSRSILEETCTASVQLHELRMRQKKLEYLLEQNPEDINALEQYAHICDQISLFDQDALTAEAKKILMGLGFHAEQFSHPVHELSIGWKMRIVLAKLLLQKADFYLFDEPTNHLDIVAKEWFLQFIKNAPFGFMLVSHERYFLDKLCSKILELERGNGTMYTGNYSHYKKQKEHAEQLQEVAYKNQQREIAQKQEWIDRFRAKATKAKMVQSAIRSLEKIERIQPPAKQKNIHIPIPCPIQSGKIALSVKNVSHTFDNKLIFNNVSFEIQRSEKIAIVAPNGAGKTTLFNLIAGKLPLQAGTITYGHQVKWALFDQDQTSSLELNKTIFENIYMHTRSKSEQEIRSFLGAFLFGNDEIQKKVRVLSGGEKNRVGMVRVLLQDANLLLLDEPTNHLDIPSKNILLKALASYTGTILFVSHDQDFVQRLATSIIDLSADGAILYQGNYESYKEQKRVATEQQATPGNRSNTMQSAKKERKKTSAITQLRQQSAKLEKKITHIEKEIKNAQVAFVDLVYGTSAFKNQEQMLRSLEEEHKALLTEWEKVQYIIEDE